VAAGDDTAPAPTSIVPPNAFTRFNGRVIPDAQSAPEPSIREIGAGSYAGGSAAGGRTPAGKATVLPGDDGEVTLNYVDTDIREIVRQILGNILKVNYSIEPGFQGQATIQTSRPLKRSELLPTLQSLLAQSGGTMLYQNGLFRVGTIGDDNIAPVVDGASYGAGSQAVPLRFASAKQLAAMLEPFIGEGGKILADPARNILVVSGSPSARANIIDLIRIFDVDYLAGQSYALFPVKSGDPSKLATDLQHALAIDSEGPLAGSLSVIPIEQANAIMVVAKRASYLERATRLISQINRISDEGGRNLHVYNLRNVQAQDLQPVLQRAINPPSGNGGEAAPGNIAPTATPAQVTGSGSGSGFSGAAAAGLQAGAPGAATGIGGQQQQAAQGAASSSSQGGAEALQADLGQEPTGAASKGPQIIADTKSNALIIVSTESEYAKIEAAIRRLDVLPMQVLIEATVAEVTLNDNLQYGTQFFLHSGSVQATLSNATSASSTSIDATNVATNTAQFPGTLASSFPGLAIAKTLGNAQFAIQALRAVTDVKVISSPKILVLDRQQAKLEVGDLVPTITQSASSTITSSSEIVNSVQYQQTGVILAVTPRINSGGLVTLDIDQEVSQVINTTTSSIDSPTFQQRKVTSKVVVQDGDTISLAGLIQDSRTKGNSGIPLLQDIPYLGNLFTTHTDDDVRTEILVLITPHVVYDQNTVRSLTEGLRRRLSATSAAAMTE
jgi:general secretion pathway protein D